MLLLSHNGRTSQVEAKAEQKPSVVATVSPLFRYCIYYTIYLVLYSQRRVCLETHLIERMMSDLFLSLLSIFVFLLLFFLFFFSFMLRWLYSSLFFFLALFRLVFFRSSHLFSIPCSVDSISSRLFILFPCYSRHLPVV